MKKLPVYILIDTSGSMMGEPIEAVKNGLQVLTSTLNSDPYALETAHLSVISFDNDARQLVPMTEITAFQPPQLKASGCTALGAALEVVSKCADNEVVKTTAEKKGDWKPLVFIMTDGEPTDDIRRGLEAFKSRKWGTVVACAAGAHANTNVLKQITENVVSLDTADSATIRQFFKWVSASVQASSMRVEEGRGEAGSLGELPPPPPQVNIIV